MVDYSVYTCKMSELIDQIIRKERIPKDIANCLRENVKKVDDDTVYYKDYPYRTPLAFINPYTTINDIFEMRIKEHMKDHIIVFDGIAVDQEECDDFYE